MEDEMPIDLLYNCEIHEEQNLMKMILRLPISFSDWSDVNFSGRLAELICLLVVIWEVERWVWFFRQ